MSTTINLGLVKLVHIGTVAPTNTYMIWYDDNIGEKIHKYYDTINSTWMRLKDLFGKKGLIDAGWFDSDNNLIIPHNLGSTDILVSIRDIDGFTNAILSYTGNSEVWKEESMNGFIAAESFTYERYLESV
nr:hypothetical protein [Candidatus Kapabacteria bacterium]